MNRSASESANTPLTAPLTVFGRPCKVCGLGCIAGLDIGADGSLCGEEEYGGGAGMESSPAVSEPAETGVGGIDRGRELVFTSGRSRSWESRES